MSTTSAAPEGATLSPKRMPPQAPPAGPDGGPPSAPPVGLKLPPGAAKPPPTGAPGGPAGVPPMGAPPMGVKAGIMPGTGGPPPPPMSYRRLLHWALIVVGGAIGLFVLATVLETGRKLLTQYNAKLLGGVISALKGGPTVTGHLSWDAMLFAGLAILLIVLQFVSQYVGVWSDTTMVSRLQQRLHDKLLALGSDYHDKHDVGRTSMTVMQFAAGAQPALKEFVSFPFVDGISLIGALVLLFGQLNSLAGMPWSVDALLGAVLLLLPVAGWRLAHRVGLASADNIRARQALNTEFLNSAQMPTEVRVMGAAPQRSRAFAASLQHAARTQRSANLALQIARQFQDAVPTVLQTVFVIYAVFIVLATGSAEVGAIVTILLLVPQVVGPVQEVIAFLTGLSANWPLIAEVGELLDATPDEVEGGETLPADAESNVVFDNVRFSYAPDLPPVVNGISYTFRPATITALVGRSGSGKSSILRLIVGLRHADAGVVSVCGMPVERADPASLRASVVTVSQFPLFITDTVRANFLLARDDATDAEIEAAARTTDLWPILERNAPRAPLDAPMGPTGQGLSGGERRIFAVTRALLRRPRVLLLDEPTTGIDAMGIDMLERCLRAACRGMTVIMVEHNLDFIERMADEVCCLEAGRLTATGPTAEMAAGDTLFAQLLRIRRGLATTEGMTIETVALPKLGAPPIPMPMPTMEKLAKPES
ncbi:MAG TPA: ABC transporter ATP-binding protein [Acidisphaera sp.]|nr:ABC transporter ATP-binding protein [Acidisphaera sp.]